MLAIRIKLLSPSLLLFLMMIVCSFTAAAQSSSENYDPLYGYDPLLFNGRVYSFYQPGTGGTQFLYDKFDTHASLTVRGVTFTNLNLNYDIYNQQLVLKYTDVIGSTKLIEISFAWLESFVLDGHPFELITQTDSTKRIYQVLGSGNLKILFYYQRKLLLHNHEISGTFYFSKIITEKYVMNGYQKVNLNSNRNFISVFTPAQQEMLKKYLRQQNLNVKKANDIMLNDLINYCNTLGGT